MKKTCYLFVFILTGIIFQFSSCGEKLYTVLIENKSSKSVSYIYNDEPNTLAPDGSKKYTVGTYTQPPKNVDVPGTMSVKMVSHIEGNFSFVDIDGSEIFNLIVTNTLPVDVIFRADKYIEYIDSFSNVFNEMEIPANEQRTGKIFTANPEFTVTPKSSASPQKFTVNWNINEQRDTITVAIYL